MYYSACVCVFVCVNTPPTTPSFSSYLHLPFPPFTLLSPPPTHTSLPPPHLLYGPPSLPPTPTSFSLQSPSPSSPSLCQFDATPLPSLSISLDPATHSTCCLASPSRPSSKSFSLCSTSPLSCSLTDASILSLSSYVYLVISFHFICLSSLSIAIFHFCGLAYPFLSSLSSPISFTSLIPFKFRLLSFDFISQFLYLAIPHAS